MACFLLYACAVVPVVVSAVVVHDDGAACADELVHFAPVGHPRGYPEGPELPEGAFQVCDEHLEQFFAVYHAARDLFERGDGAPDAYVVAGVAVHVYSDAHADGGGDLPGCGFYIN